MRTRPPARLALLGCVATVLAGCAGTSGDGGPSAPPLQLRMVTSSTEGPCSAPPLTSDGPGSACDRTGTTTFELGAPLGVVTPTSVTQDDPGSAQTVALEFDEADARTLTAASTTAVGSQLAVLLDGTVLSAATVGDPITGSTVTFAFGTAAEARQVAAELGASATS